jgi:heme-degrading monooxygenase HmoA
MIIRIWRGRVKKEGIQSFIGTVTEHDIPVLHSQEGCVQALFGKRKDTETEYIITSIWDDLDSLKKFTGPNWQDPIPGATEKQVLEGKPTVEHFLMTPYGNLSEPDS